MAAVGLLSTLSVAAASDYLGEIKPVLKERCYACHGALKQKAGLRVDTAASLLESGVVGSGELLRRLTHADSDERMPPEGEAVEEEFLHALRVWIAEGAPVPEGEAPEAAVSEHWAYQRVERPALPVEGANPVDAFLGERQREEGLVAQGEAERGLLLRRVYVDLLGYPPTAGDVADGEGYEAVVERLLADPAYGERWGRHFMDIWRYTDWYGLGAQLRNGQKHLWRWRDWIVESLNEDKGYDRMVMEMLAGDELAPGDLDVVRGTGFLARNYYLFNRTTWLDSTIEHTSKAFLGLTMDCAKCHDHKYDPVLQRDYYAMRAIFEPHQVRLDAAPGEVNFEKDGVPRVYDARPDDPTYLHVRGDEKQADTSEVIGPGVPGAFGVALGAIEPVALPVAAYAPGTREAFRDDVRRWHDAAVAKAKRELDAARERVGGGGDVRGEVIFEENFDVFDDQRWEILGDGWGVSGGALRKTAPDRKGKNVSLVGGHANDFDVEVEVRIAGGPEYKSVGVHFDVGGGGTWGTSVYISAHGPEPKLQVAHGVGGKMSYPASGRVAMGIEVGRDYVLGVRVKGRVLNASLDGKLVLAYALPERGEGRGLELNAFDVTAAFESVVMRRVAGELAEPGERAGLPVEVLEARLAGWEAKRAAVEARIAADGARYVGEGDVEVLGEAALAAEREAAVLQAKATLLEERHLGDAKKVKAAEGALAKAKKALGSEGGRYEVLRGSKKALEGPDKKDEEDPRVYSKVSSGRRLAFAKWIVSRDNPLAARVVVNHVWLRHFGEPLVESVFDFGRRAERPEHLALLDYLAVELMESGWSLKHLHRLLVTSEAYKRSSSNYGADEATMAADPGNRFYWRMNPRRMESQVVRDSLLVLAGELDETMGGAPVDVGTATKRRSLYFKHSRDQRDKFLSMFDDADFLGCYRRQESIVPQQALALANSKLALEMAEKIAAGLGGDGMGAFVREGFRAVLGREAGEDEVEACLEFCEEVGGDAGRVRVLLVHSLLNHNDFVTVR